MSTSTTRIVALETELPRHCISAAETKDHLRSLLGDRAERFCRIVDASRIERRFCVAPVDELLQFRTLEARNAQHARHALALGEATARKVLATSGIAPESVTTLISVCSSGHMMPSLDAHLIDRLGLSHAARRIPIAELGCSGGLAAVGLASDMLARRPNTAALIVSAELSSLCLQVAEISPTDALAAILFGDGAAAVLLARDDARGGLEVLTTGSVLWPDTRHFLGMRLTDTGLRPVISPALPRLIRTHLSATVSEFVRASGFRLEDISFWAVHPGGPKILEAVAECLQLKDDALDASWSIWKQCGNMASATVFFILRQLQASAPPAAGTLGMMLAFGPGVSCEMVLLRSSES